jgi:hypothetical protein
MNFVLGPISMNVVIRLGLEASALQCGVYMNNLQKRDFTAFYPDFFWEKIPFAIQFIYIYIYICKDCLRWLKGTE